MKKVIKVHGEEWDDRVDATDTIRIPIRKTDFNAEERNTAQCVLAQAVKRSRKINGRVISRVWIGANVCDVVFKDQPRILYRYFLSSEDVKRVSTFDRHPDLVKEVGAWVQGITITLVPPPPTKKLGVKRRSGTDKRTPGNRQAPLRHLFAEVVA